MNIKVLACVGIFLISAAFCEEAGMSQSIFAPAAMPAPKSYATTIAETHASAHRTAEDLELLRRRRRAERRIVFSVRPELLLTNVTSVGASAEVGYIGHNGFYLSATGSGGLKSGGFLGNVGFCLNKNGKIKQVLGVCIGHRQINYVLSVRDVSGNEIFTGKGNTGGGFGIFFKTMFGKRNNFDITGVLLEGHKDVSAHNLSSSRLRDRYSGSTAIFSLGVGYALTRGRSYRTQL